MYVKEAFVGKKLGPRKLDIRARGKMGLIHSVISMLTIRLEEKPLEQMVREIISGKGDPGVGHNIRQVLF